MKAKRFVALLLSAVMCLSMASCSAESGKPAESEKTAEAPVETPAAPAETPAEKITINIAALKGPTALGMLNVMEADEAGTTANDYEFLLAGASAVAVGTANFVDPYAPLKVIDYIKEYMERKNISKVADLVGAVRC